MLGTMVLLFLTLVLARATASTDRVVFCSGDRCSRRKIGKLAVVFWTSMLIVKKGTVSAAGEGTRPVPDGVGALDLLAALQPDLSVACSTPCSWRCCCSPAVRVFATLRRRPHLHTDPRSRALAHPLCACPHSGIPQSGNGGRGRQHASVQSLIAVGSGGFSGAATDRTAAVRLRSRTDLRLHRQQLGRSGDCSACSS